MKLRNILLILGLLAFFSATIGGYLYYSAITEASFQSSQFQAAAHFETMQKLVNSFFADKLKVIKVLAGLKDIELGLVQPNQKNLAEIDFILDTFNDSLEASVVYLMDPEGKTISSSNRYSPASFVGKNYSFRPYFQQAISGIPSIYIALGTTSKQRGVYYSYPVSDEARNNAIGVVVIKFSVDNIEKKIIHSLHFDTSGMTTVITGPGDTIFMSSRKELLYQLLWEITDDQIASLRASKQFGKGPWKWAGFKKESETRVVDRSGYEYLLFQKEIEQLPGWNIVQINKLDVIAETVVITVANRIRPLIILLCFLFCLVVFLLYNMARSDINKGILAEKSLRESEKKLRLIFDQVLMGVALTETKTEKYLQVNERYCDIVGYTKEELEKISFMEITHHDDRQLDIEHMEKLNQGKIQNFSIEKRFIRKNGQFVWVNLTVSLMRDADDQKREYHVAVIEDITQRKHVEEALLRSISLLDATLEASADGILVVANDGSIATFNKKFAELWRVTDNISTSKNDAHILDYVRDQLVDPDEFVKNVNMIYNQPEIETFDELKFKDGRLVERFSKPQKIDDKVVGRVWSFRDITKPRENIEKLRQLSRAIESGPATVVIANHEGRIEYVNKMFTTITGYSKEEVLGKSPKILNSGVHSSKFYQDLWKTVLSGKDWHGEICNRKKDGQLFWEKISISPLLDNSGNITNFVAVKEDISDQKMRDTELQENMEVLERFRKMSVEREIKMVQLKKEINELLSRSGRKERYSIVQL